MFILDLLKNKWESRKEKNYTYDIRMKRNHHESRNTWESRLVMYWDMMPEDIKSYMRANPDTLIAASPNRSLIRDNPMYALLGAGTFLAASEGYRSDSHWRPGGYDHKIYKDLDSMKKLPNFLQRIHVEETTYYLKFFGFRKILLDLELSKKVQDVEKILALYEEVGWMPGEIVKVPGSKHYFISLYLNPYS